MNSDDIPGEILQAVTVINRLQPKTYLSRDERENLNRAKLRIAYWACRNENVVANRDNLAYILGPDAGEIMNAYDKYLDRDTKGKQAADGAKRRTKGKDFWSGA